VSITAALQNVALSGAQTGSKSRFIAGPLYDYIFFIYSPLLALLLGIYISDSAFTNNEVELLGREAPLANIFIGTFIMAHLVIVFFRSHLNYEIFKLHPLRFTLVPVALFIAMTTSEWAAVMVGVLATWWDVYHSSLQTFGLGRIYDMKMGNSPQVGRRLDMGLNLLLYAGPILAGATLMDHVNDFSQFEDVGAVFFTSIPATVESNRRYLTWAVLAIGVPYLLFYVLANWCFHRQGYQISFPKVALLVSTGFCSIFTWGFNTFGEAFFIMNFFHALQYFGIVWWMEKKSLTATLGLQDSRFGKPIALVLLLTVGFGYGFWAEMIDGTNEAAYNLIMVIAIMHFWYDGFIWSVRKKQV